MSFANAVSLHPFPHHGFEKKKTKTKEGTYSNRGLE